MRKILPWALVLGLSTTALAGTAGDRGNQGSNARNSASGEKANQIMSGAMGIGTGAALAAAGCGESGAMNVMMCVAGIGGGIQSVMALMAAGKNTDPSGNPLDTSPDFCASNPDFCGVPDPFKEPAIIDALNDFGTIAKTQGVDINDPASMQNYLNKHADDMGGAAGASMELPMSAQAKLDKLKKNLESKYKVSSVALEGGGGGRMNHGGGKDANGFDLSKFLDQKDRGPASMDGLQRRLASGEPVGVASDDIFKLVSRKYQVKIGAKTFLNPVR